MNILVIGGLGCVGTPLVNELRSRGHEVWVADKAHNHDTKYIRCDISKYRQVEKLFEQDFDYVYNLAAEFGRYNVYSVSSKKLFNFCIKKIKKNNNFLVN